MINSYRGRVIVFDPMGEHHALASALPGEVLVFKASGDNEKENPLQPPGSLRPLDWVARLKNILTELFLKDGSLNLFEDVLHRAYRNYGVLNGSTNYPTLKEILSGTLEKMDLKPGTRKHSWNESLKNRIRSLARISNFDCREGYDLARVLDLAKIVVFQLCDLSSIAKLFYVNIKLEKLRQCLAEHLGEFGRVLIIIDEAYQLTSPLLRKRTEIAEPLIYQCVRQFGRYNASFLLIDHFAAGIPRPIYSCLGNIFVLRQNEATSIKLLKDTRNLDEEQAVYLSTIPPRHVVHCPAEDSPRLVRIRDLDLHPVSEEELAASMKPLLEQLKYVPVGDSPPPAEPKQVTIKKIDRQILEHVLEHPFQNLALISRSMGDLSSIIAKNGLKKLEDQGYIESFTANLGKGRPKKLYLGNEKGAEALGEDYQKVKPKGKGSLLHRAAQHLIAETLGGSGQGMLVEYGSADVAEVLDEGKLRAWELELRPNSGDIANQVIKDFQAGFSEVVVLAINREDLEKVKKRVHEKLEQDCGQDDVQDNNSWLNHVRFDLLRNYINLD